MQYQPLSSSPQIKQRLAALRAHRPQRWGRGLLVVTLALCLGAPTLAVVNDTFSDVPASAFYHDAVNAIFGAGITGGCAPGLYCPDDPVTRAQMAVLLHRGLDRTAYDDGGPVALTGTFTDVAVLSINAGGLPDKAGFVKLDAAITASNTSGTGCPCEVQYFITGNSPVVLSFSHYVTVNNMTATVTSDASGKASIVVAVPTGATWTYRLQARITAAAGNPAVNARGTITALYVPFGNTGGNTIMIETGMAPSPQTQGSKPGTTRE